MRAEAESLGVKLGAASSWVRPELLALPAGKIQAALAAWPGALLHHAGRCR